MAAHSTETSFVVFNMYYGYVERSIAPLFLIDFCGIYFTMLLLLVVHFIYRYLVVCDFKKIVYFEGYKLIPWIVVPTILGYSNAILKMFTFPERETVTEKLRPLFSAYYNLTMEAVVYNGPNYYECDGNGNCQKPIEDWATMIWLTSSLVFCIVTMCFCGYRSIAKLSTSDPNASIRTVELQRQLMVALLIQSAIPMIFMYIPIVLLFMTPMFQLSLGPYVNIAMATLAIYPPIDQFAIIYVIKDFRTAVKGVFNLGKKPASQASSFAVARR